VRGIGLIEVAIATALLAVMALGIAPLLIGAVRANANARLELDAATAAGERMEQLLAAPFTAPLSSSDSLNIDYPGFSDVVDSPAGRLTRRWSVTAYASDPANTRVFSVRVLAAGRPPLATFTTVRTRTGP
jgi:Tfp pilus assembly protein PilV